MKQIKALFLSLEWSLASCLFKVIFTPNSLGIIGDWVLLFTCILIAPFWTNQLIWMPVVPGEDECSLFKWFGRTRRETTVNKKLRSIIGSCGATCLRTCECRPVVVMCFVSSINRTVFLSELLPRPHSTSDHEPFLTAAFGSREAERDLRAKAEQSLLL